MLKDMTDSQRIDQHIQAQNEVTFVFHPVMPLLNDERVCITFGDHLETLLAAFTRE